MTGWESVQEFSWRHGDWGTAAWQSTYRKKHSKGFLACVFRINNLIKLINNFPQIHGTLECDLTDNINGVYSK